MVVRAVLAGLLAAEAGAARLRDLGEAAFALTAAGDATAGGEADARVGLEATREAAAAALAVCFGERAGGDRAGGGEREGGEAAGFGFGVDDADEVAAGRPEDFFVARLAPPPPAAGRPGLEAALDAEAFGDGRAAAPAARVEDLEAARDDDEAAEAAFLEAGGLAAAAFLRGGILTIWG